jgi:hypothetical protein
MTRHLPKLLPVLLAAVLLVGCQTSRNQYYWGHYEDIVYVSYANPGTASVDSQVLIMETDLQKAGAAGLRVPPGFHAQLGYLYFQQGKADLARQEFETEKRLFPEAAVLMDRLSANLARK